MQRERRASSGRTSWRSSSPSCRGRPSARSPTSLRNFSTESDGIELGVLGALLERRVVDVVRDVVEELGLELLALRDLVGLDRRRRRRRRTESVGGSSSSKSSSASGVAVAVDVVRSSTASAMPSPSASSLAVGDAVAVGVLQDVGGAVAVGVFPGVGGAVAVGVSMVVVGRAGGGRGGGRRVGRRVGGRGGGRRLGRGRVSRRRSFARLALGVGVLRLLFLGARAVGGDEQGQPQGARECEQEDGEALGHRVTSSWRPMLVHAASDWNPGMTNRTDRRRSRVRRGVTVPAHE